MGADMVRDGRLKLGDRVAGAADGMEPLRPRSGAFAEYVSIDGDMTLKLLDDMSFEVGASMPLRIATSAMALFHSLQLPKSLLEKPAEEPFDVLVYGGATSTGTLAIQLLKHCGLRVITTCSPRNFDLVRSYGADACFDYNSPTCGADIRAFTNNALDYALDCITKESSMKICYQALGRCGGRCTPFPSSGPSTLDSTPPHLTKRHNRRRPRALSRNNGDPSHRRTGLGPRHVDEGLAHQLARAVRHPGQARVSRVQPRGLAVHPPSLRGR